ncbi:3'-5' exonuclease [Brettanomyces nanus]|uniref:3'-5' exonuclease n=1 Tax=Eeniella nana TaxID=13502 RepID=A0A875S026_EENNA|nr:3'-5' exonuclease [Brettanomyces nanus]QPG74766.1 3'-5' exonuclease [Brettanomyces nanus]
MDPRHSVTDWRTWVSGITPKSMKKAIDFEDAQKLVTQIIKNKIVVGHDLKHDLDSLCLNHPKYLTRDTSKHPPFRHKYSAGKTPSLKKLTKEILHQDIQTGQHSSVQDAKATMLIYQTDRLEFERLAKIHYS